MSMFLTEHKRYYLARNISAKISFFWYARYPQY